MPSQRPRRSILYLPGSNARAIEKARDLEADVVIIDLEDAVAPAAKEAAREAAVAAVRAGGWGRREIAIRVNGLATPWSEADFAAVAASGADVLVVPKIDGATDAAVAVARAGGLPVWPLIETPRSVQAVDAIADVAGIEGLVCGFADLTKDLRARPGADRAPLLYAASRIVNAARASGILAFDGVFVDIQDEAGLEAETRQGLALGFDGKTCIHPSQLATVNRLFSPTAEEVAHAQGVIEAHATAVAEGRGVATFKGKLIEVLHVVEANRVLKVAEEIGGIGAATLEIASEI
ncbi:HpcH/HpaI aldolase/citrate lyase family protein [Sandaracinobacteroides saxicola]|uniref:CoA ester lyase n=1 Tax=Sandaracinobacteroides saxicola TaxID=2759707 RepID=A0A7G5IHA8_9SPHN|nr:CoA ester lyase [Sandaracinobacteroides saxicola]QMW22750.1 CoA ester lyase [Sandaracinobacteroides saxicola]